jgi:imidazolonepropionase-like amidohydrolase
MKVRLLVWLIFSVAVGAATAADQKALVGGRLVDGYGGRPIANSVILIQGDSIEAVGSIDTLAVPDGYQVISTEGMTVLPGLWESHAHLMINGHADYPHWQRSYTGRFAKEIMPASAVQLLLAGITTARDLGAPLDASASVKARIKSGEIPGPRLFVSGPFLQHEVQEWQSVTAGP